MFFKRLVCAIFFLPLAECLLAQPDGLVNLIGVPYRYWASDNYQICERFEYCSGEYVDRNYFHLDYYTGRGDTTELFVTRSVSSRQVRIKGVAVMKLLDMNDVNPYHTPYNYYDSAHVEEELMVWSDDIETAPLPVATAIWNEKAAAVVEVTAPQCMQTMYDGDSSKFLHFGLCEVFFDQPVTVDSVFFIGGTMRNNRLVSSGGGIGSDRFAHRPTVYPYVSERYSNPCASCVYDYGHFVGTNATGGQWQQLDGGKMWSGPFFLILAESQFRLNAMADDSTHGMVTGSGIYDSSERVIVRAIPFAGFRFAGWSDGATENPRIVEVAQDTTVVAYFRDAMGLGEVSESERTFLLYPNPAHEELFVTAGDEEQGTLTLYDAAGRVLLRCPFFRQMRLDVGSLAAGQYFVVVTCGEEAHVEALVKR